MAASSRNTGHHTISGNISFEAKKGDAARIALQCIIAVCKFGYKTFCGCCTTRETAHILGSHVLGLTKAGTQMYWNQQKRWLKESNLEKCTASTWQSHHSACAEALNDLFLLCDIVHGAEKTASAKARLDWLWRCHQRQNGTLN